ncbi:MAG: hypothetical protein M3132_14380 [Actinomycetia bacterium]|nr:hypothetical protein [Actinomycetes bacterium]
MRRLSAVLTVALLLVMIVAPAAVADAPDKCATIQGGTITDTAGTPIVTGYDEFGYNYQAHMFNGTYDSSDRNIDGTYWGQTGDYVDDALAMKWSDAWLANVDCNDDGKLDRGLVDGTVSGISMGWLTNHLNGDYIDGDGVEQHYTDFVKIVWVGAGGSLWGQYELIQEVYNDPAAGETGLFVKIGIPGLGLNEHWTTD